jgi:hypothetical protein
VERLMLTKAQTWFVFQVIVDLLKRGKIKREIHP